MMSCSLSEILPLPRTYLFYLIKPLLLDAAVQQANWDPSKFRDKLRHDMSTHASFVQNEKLSGIVASYQVTF